MDWTLARGDRLPQRQPAPKYRVVYPTPGNDLILKLLDHAWLGVDCHWLPASNGKPGRTILCSLPDACTCQTNPLPCKWQAYIGITSCRSKDVAILSLTQRGVDALMTVAGDERSLRGLKVSCRRATDHPSSRLVFHVLVEDKPQPCPPSFDLLPSLEAIYGRDALNAWAARNLKKDGAS